MGLTSGGGAPRVNLRFGGRKGLAGGEHAEPPTDETLELFLGWLSKKFVLTQATFSPHQIPSSGSAEMKDDIAHWIGRVWMLDHPLPDRAHLSSFDILSLEKEYVAWIHQHGASLFDDGMAIEEIWFSQQLHDRKAYTVVVCDRFVKELTGRIDQSRVLDAQSLVWVLGAMCAHPLIDVSTGFNVLVAHGETAHTISLRGMNSIRFDHPRGDVEVPEGWLTFHDPWPARSLLTQSGVEPRITVLENIAMPPYWLISPEDLAKVAVGFLFPTEDFDIVEDMLVALTRWRVDPTSRERPPWLELSSSDEQFPVLRAVGAPLRTLFPSQVGLAQVALVTGDVEAAQDLLESAYRLQPTEASSGLFAGIMEKFEQPGLASAWRLRTPRG
jgi:hypothetical protein